MVILLLKKEKDWAVPWRKQRHSGTPSGTVICSSDTYLMWLPSLLFNRTSDPRVISSFPVIPSQVILLFLVSSPSSQIKPPKVLSARFPALV